MDSSVVDFDEDFSRFKLYVYIREFVKIVTEEYVDEQWVTNDTVEKNYIPLAYINITTPPLKEYLHNPTQYVNDPSISVKIEHISGEEHVDIISN